MEIEKVIVELSLLKFSPKMGIRDFVENVNLVMEGVRAGSNLIPSNISKATIYQAILSIVSLINFSHK